MPLYEVTRTQTEHTTVRAESTNEAEQLALALPDEEWTDDGCDMSAEQLDDDDDLDDDLDDE